MEWEPMVWAALIGAAFVLYYLAGALMDRRKPSPTYAVGIFCITFACVSAGITIMSLL